MLFRSQKYIKSRYSHIIIDEFQDSGLQQYQFFCHLINQKLISIAVGDIDQSIFGFARKSPDYLIALQSRTDFEPYIITKNHRCHKSIVNYSKKLLLPSLKIEVTERSRVIYKCIEGTQVEISKYIDKLIPTTKEKLDINENKKIAILVRSDVSGNIINNNLITPHKYIKNTILDNSSETWARIFANVLFYLFDKNALITDFLENWIIYDLKKEARNYLIQMMQSLKNTEVERLKEQLQVFEGVASILCPNNYSSKSLNLLEQVLNNDEDLSSYIPVSDDEIQIMTVHKSKGLEFDIVLHLDLYRFIIPSFGARESIAIWNEDLNLHYVAITRAKKACFLLSSSKRYNYKGKILDNKESEFLALNSLKHYRQNI